MASRRDITRDIDPYCGDTAAVAGAGALERRANAASYYPTASALDHVAAKSNTPVSEAVAIRLESAWAA